MSRSQFMRKDWHYRATPVSEQQRQDVAQAQQAHDALLGRIAAAVRMTKATVGLDEDMTLEEIRERVIDSGGLSLDDVGPFRVRVTDRSLRLLLDVERVHVA